MDFDDLIDFLDSDDNEFGLSSIATHGFLTASIGKLIFLKGMNNKSSQRC